MTEKLKKRKNWDYKQKWLQMLQIELLFAGRHGEGKPIEKPLPRFREVIFGNISEINSIGDHSAPTSH